MEKKVKVWELMYWRKASKWRRIHTQICDVKAHCAFNHALYMILLLYELKVKEGEK